MDEETPDAFSISLARESAYRSEADPLFFKWQRGEAEKETWLEKVQEIRTRFPYPEISEESPEEPNAEV